MPEQDRFVFTIPASFIDAEFTKHKNGNWKFTLINTSTHERHEIAKSIKPETAMKLSAELILGPNEPLGKEWKHNIDILKEKVKKYKSLNP
jgi:hypothetical protein